MDLRTSPARSPGRATARRSGAVLAPCIVSVRRHSHFCWPEIASFFRWRRSAIRWRGRRGELGRLRGRPISRARPGPGRRRRRLRLPLLPLLLLRLRRRRHRRSSSSNVRIVPFPFSPTISARQHSEQVPATLATGIAIMPRRTRETKKNRIRNLLDRSRRGHWKHADA